MKIFTSMLLPLVVSVSASSAQFVDAIRPGHPRIYINSSELPALCARCNDGPYGRFMSEKATDDGLLSLKATIDSESFDTMTYVAFVYLVSRHGGCSTGYDSRYLDKTVEYLDAMAANPPRDRYLTPEWIRAGCQCADWTWNDLTPEQRRRYGMALIEMAEWVERYAPIQSDFSNHMVNEHLSVLYVPALLEGEGIAPDRVAILKQRGIRYLYGRILPAEKEVASPPATAPSTASFARYLAEPIGKHPDAPCFVGGQVEGFGYNDWGHARPLVLTCEMWRSATGKDLIKGSTYFQGQSVWHGYAMQGYPGHGFLGGEDLPGGVDSHVKNLMWILSARMQDPLAKWMAERYANRDIHQVTRLMFEDKNLAAQSPTQLNLPLAGCFPKLGHVYFRGTWQEEGAASALFQCGPFYSGHQHLDNNSFIITRNDGLAIDSDAGDYAIRGNYSCRTIAHNAILVYDPLEKFSGDPWSKTGTTGPNDGGQMRQDEIVRAGLFKPGGLGDCGTIVDFANSAYVAGCVGDATMAYSPHKVKRAVRAFYHLRPDTPPGNERTDAFVVYDDVETTSPQYPITWVIHGPNQPVLAPNSFTFTDYNNQNNQLTGRIISPTPATLNLVGGPGKEFWVDGHNYLPYWWWDSAVRTWRIEMPIAGHSLVLLYAHAKGVSEPPATVAIKNGVQVVTVKLGQLTYQIRLSSAVHAMPSVAVFRDGLQVELLQLQAWSTVATKVYQK